MLFQSPADRRTFLIDLGRFSAAVSVVGLAACQPSGEGTPGPSMSASSEPSDGASGRPSAPSPAASNPPSGGSPESAALTWRRVNLGFVSAYVLARGGEAAVVDTGVAGSEGGIEATLSAMGLSWSAVAHLILTHRHPDHVGSAAEVRAKAPDTEVYAGAADTPAINLGGAQIIALTDGDSVFDLQIVSTPGHTAGHIAVYDARAGILVAGDALNNRTGTLAGSSPQNTDNETDAVASVKKMAGLSFGTLLVGHGEPIVGDADARVRELAASL